MTTVRARVCIAFIAATMLGCDDGHSAEVAVNTPDGQRLDGMWTIELHVDRLRFESTAEGNGQARMVRGEIALVSNHWLHGGDDLPHPTQYGTYDVDFGALGFDPRHRGQMPHATARMRDHDSVELVLEPDDAHESVHLRGAWRGDSIGGNWSLEPVRSGGDAAGTFTMKRPPHR